ncbi:MAG: CPBP family intramembrane metalloprotease [Candidatus Lokiarchaeota archaeon]|nr:CPBP family intramembrane metalloprotease [Candidatus Lokiarchaeota archaeon]
MTIRFGDNSWILILVTFLELLFLFIPPYIASKIEHNTLKEQLIILGFHKSQELKLEKMLKIISGIGLSILFLVFAVYMSFFFTYISRLIFGLEFVELAQQGSISTGPVNPDMLQLVIIIFQQIFIIGICEEAFFRSFLIKKLRNKFGYITCILISSIFFAIYHVPPFIVPFTTIVTYFGYYFTFGVLLSLIFIFYKESLLPAIISHGFFNIIIIILPFLN